MKPDRLRLIRPSSGLLAPDVLHYPASVRLAPAWHAEPPNESAEATRLAATLIDAATGCLDWGFVPAPA